MNKFKIDKVSIENFRGFKKETVFKFDNNYNAIIVSGMNGIGKTSLYDAIEWAFTGELIRYSESGDEKNCKFINFQPSESNELAKVSIVLKSEKISFTVIRELCKMRKSVVSDYGSKKTRLTVVCPEGNKIYEEEAAKFIDETLINKIWKGKVKFNDVFGQYHLLSQDKIKYFVQGIKMPERYEYFANLLGTERYLKIIPELKEKENLIKNKNEEINKIIYSTKQKIAILCAKNINHKELDIFNIKELEETILNDIKYINHVSELYKLGFNLDTKNISLKTIENINENILKIYFKLEDIRNKHIKEGNELNEIKIGHSTFEKNLINNKIYEEILELYSKLEKLKYMKSNKEQYKVYEKNKRDKIDRKKIIQREIKILEQKISFLQTIYSRLSNQNTELQQNNVDKVDIGKIESIFNNNTINLNDGKFFMSIDNENKICIKSINDNSFNDFNNKYSIFREEKFMQIKGLKNQYNDLERIYNINKNEKSSLQDQIKNLLDIDNDLKSILIEARGYLSKQKSISCPVCDSNINYTNTIAKIDKKLNDSNPVIEKLNVRLNEIEINMKHNQVLLQSNMKNSKYYIMEYINYVNVLLKNIQDTIFKLKEEINLKQTKIEYIDSELNSLEKINDKYIMLIEEFAIQNIDIDIDHNIKIVNNDVVNLGFDYEDYKIDEILSVKYNNNLNIKLYEKKIMEKNIDVNNIEKCIEILLEKENKKKNSLEEQLNKINKIKDRVKSIYMYLKENEDYRNLQDCEKKLEQLNIKKDYNDKKLKDINKLKNAISDVVSKLNQEIMEENKNMINSVFRKIFPSPYYKQLDFIFDKSRSKDILKLQCNHIDETTTINPAYIFSSTQTNIISVSVFLGIAIKQNCTNLDLILLDDPVQNMDDMNVLSFIDVLRGCIDQNVLDKQIIISTHDERVTNLFAKKFRFFNTKVYKFIEYTREGPKIESRELNGLMKF